MNKKLNAKQPLLCWEAMVPTSGCNAIVNLTGGMPVAANALWAGVPQMPGPTQFERKQLLPHLVSRSIVKTAANAKGSVAK